MKIKQGIMEGKVCYVYTTLVEGMEGDSFFR
ncbi:hypothetical protein IMSAGC011_02387 [Lachnospiraceae bacterium]|nr:hypothetical protein IMSAGC011_02387 [Lachnospiraceae bacterium]